MMAACLFSPCMRRHEWCVLHLHVENLASRHKNKILVAVKSAYMNVIVSTLNESAATAQHGPHL